MITNLCLLDFYHAGYWYIKNILSFNINLFYGFSLSFKQKVSFLIFLGAIYFYFISYVID